MNAPLTVQTFNSYTGGPDVCQCLAVQTPIDNMPNTSMTYVAFESKLHMYVQL